MSNDFIFSWAENAEGRMVHVDSVSRGLQCGCTCPNCHEPLLARHGEKNEHGFAHHSDTRGANLNICYMVSIEVGRTDYSDKEKNSCSIILRHLSRKGY